MISVAPTDEALIAAARLLRAGQLVAFPTETVYGLGADATNSAAVAAIFEAKGRPRFNPMIAHVADTADVAQFAVLEGAAITLAAAFWPGPLTLVLPRRAGGGISDLVTAGLDTVAVRVPSHLIARDLLRRAGVPVAAPSANKSGHVSPTTAAHVEVDLGDKVAMVIDGGATSHGLESTVVAATAGIITMLRPGAITAAEIEAVLGRPVQRAFEGGDRPQSPGQLQSHYAPRARLRPNAVSVGADEALLGFGPTAPITNGPAINLSATANLVEAATGLFAALRALDLPGITTIAVMSIPQHGLGEAINDRLRRAAKGR